jgi:hypothetical protein
MQPTLQDIMNSLSDLFNNLQDSDSFRPSRELDKQFRKCWAQVDEALDTTDWQAIRYHITGQDNRSQPTRQQLLLSSINDMAGWSDPVQVNYSGTDRQGDKFKAFVDFNVDDDGLYRVSIMYGGPTIGETTQHIRREFTKPEYAYEFLIGHDITGT